MHAAHEACAALPPTCPPACPPRPCRRLQTAQLIGGSSDAGEVGGHGPAAYFAAEGYWEMPLEWAPGEGYRYSNANFQLAAYIVEKVGGARVGPLHVAWRRRRRWRDGAAQAAGADAAGGPSTGPPASRPNPTPAPSGQVSGLPFGQYLRQRILQPAGLNATHYDIVSPPRQLPTPAACSTPCTPSAPTPTRAPHPKPHGRAP